MAVPTKSESESNSDKQTVTVNSFSIGLGTGGSKIGSSEAFLEVEGLKSVSPPLPFSPGRPPELL